MDSFMRLMVENDGSKMQNVYTPLSLGVHFVFCIIATALYLTLYYRRGSVHYLLLMFAIDATIITQYWTTSVSITLLAIVEIVLIGLAIWFYIKYSKRVKEQRAAKEEARKQDELRAKAAQKAEDEKNKQVVDNAFDD